MGFLLLIAVIIVQDRKKEREKEREKEQHNEEQKDEKDYENYCQSQLEMIRFAIQQLPRKDRKRVRVMLNGIPYIDYPAEVIYHAMKGDPSAKKLMRVYQQLRKDEENGCGL